METPPSQLIPHRFLLPPRWLDPSTLVLEALPVLLQHESTTFALVGSSTTELQGILTKQEVIKGLAAYGDLSQVRIDQIMATPVVTLPLQDAQDPEYIYDLMEQRGLQTLPIKADGSVVGVATWERILQASHEVVRQREQGLNRVMYAIRDSLDLTTVFETATREVTELLRGRWGHIAQYLPERGCWRTVVSFGSESDFEDITGLEVPDADNPLAERLKQGQMVKIDDTSTLEDPVNHLYAERFPGSWLMVPLQVNQRVWGCIGLLQAPPQRLWSNGEVALAQRIADELGIAIHQAMIHQRLQSELEERVQAELKLQQSQQDYQNLINSLDCVVWEGDPATSRYTFMSQHVEALLGYPLERWHDLKSWIEVIHPEDQDTVLSACLEAMAAQRDHVLEYRMVAADGRIIWVYEKVSMVTIAGILTKVAGIVIDTTDLKIAQLALAQSERLNRSIVQAIPDMLLRVHRDGTYLQLVDQGEVTVYNPEYALQTNISIFNILPAEEAATRMKHVHKALETGEIQLYDYELEMNGSIQYEEARVVPYPGVERPDEVLIIIRDITDRKIAEEAIQDSEARLREQAALKHQLLQQTKHQAAKLRRVIDDLNAIVDNLADGLLVITSAGYIALFNPALVSMFQLSMSDIYDQAISDLFPSNLVELIERIRLGERVDRSTIEVTLSNNYVGQALATPIARFSEDGKDNTYDVVVLIRDVTREREIERMKSEFLSLVSHELRTPLTSVFGFISLIKETLEDDLFPKLTIKDSSIKQMMQRILDNMDIIDSEMERLMTLINDVLDSARLEEGRINWNLQIVDLSNLIKKAVDVTSTLLRGRPVILTQSIALNLPRVTADPDRVLQVLINLLSNAVKFTLSGSIVCQVRQEHDYLVTSIIDTGIGISKHNQGQIFERFRQVDAGIGEKPRGSGLGLSICKRIIEYHGGQIWVESLEGQGSTFSFTLPVVPTLRDKVKS